MSTAARYNVANLLRVVVFGVWIFGFMWLLAGGRYQLFLQTWLSGLLIAALVLLVVFFAAVYFRFGQPASHYGNLWERGGQAALLLLPLFYMVIGVQAGGLGGDAFAQRSVRGQGAAQGLLTPGYERDYSAEGVNDVTLLELVNDLEALDGKRVSLIGRVFHPQDRPEDEIVVYRFIIVCCAADALPVGAHVRHEAAAELPADRWVRVEGELGSELIDGESAPYIRATSVEQIEPPANPYMSPF